VAVEIPGTRDSTALKEDPTSPKRQWSSILDRIDNQPYLDSEKVAVYGVSPGGYYALRVAHTHADWLIGVVAQGGGSHHMFDEEWINAAPHLEYSFE
jgi:dipeptidyl aminopeptidase/acylaminoacyl peptidase